MLWCGDSKITNDAAMQDSWIVKIDQVAGKVRAVVGHQIEASPVWLRIVFANERVVLFFSGIQLETINSTAIVSPQQFRPASARYSPLGAVGCDGLEMSSPILISE